jgi:hypothetical protein
MTQRYKEVRELMRSVSALPPSELPDEYNISLWADGRVHDLFDGITYASLQEWAEAQFSDSGEDIDHPQHYQ